MIAVLSCLGRGLVVMPVDDSSPPARLALTIEEARPAARIEERTSGELEVARTQASGRFLPVGSAYLLFTSGSTGRPKGVVVSAEALAVRLEGLARTPGLQEGESMLALTSFTFDISMAELLLPLTVGATVVAADPDARIDPTLLSSTSPSDVYQGTPSYWRLALQAGWRGAASARIWCGGEALTPTLARQLMPRCSELWNLYGPTEATIWAMASHVTDPQTINLGQPLDRTSIRLMSATGSVVSEYDEPGELVITGDALATGYLDRPELTAERFALAPGSGVRTYRTGDRARHRQGGGVEFLGRLDGQVKISGHRIEVGEVESVLEQHPAVSEAAVIVVCPAEAAEPHLVAYVVSEATVLSLRQWLVQQLPSSMIPRRFIPGAELPRTSAGKVDRVLLQQSAERPSDGRPERAPTA